MKAEQKILTGFIGNNENFEIPFFQRSYVWDKEQWQRLVDDVIFSSSSRKPFFLGAMIFKEKQDENGIIEGNIVIDGQQRLTTLFIFYKVLCLLTSQSMWFNSTFLKNSDNKPILTQSHSNIGDFNYILSLPTPVDIEVNENSSQIKKAYKFFLAILRDIILLKNNKDENNKPIIDYQNLYKLMNFVVISLGNNEDEQLIFDTINSLGVKLTTGELLKNYLFSNVNIDDYSEIWKPIFEKDQETLKFWDSQITTGRLNKKTIDVFLYYFLQVKTQDKEIKGDKKLYRRWENLFSSFKTLVVANHIDKKSLAKEITEYAKIFIECFNHEEDDIPSTFGIERISFIINNLDSMTLIPYVLFILKEVPDENERNKIFGFLESYIIRRLITNANNNNYSDLFTENLIGQRIKTYDSLVKYIASKDPSVSVAMPSNQDVIFGFKNTQFKNNNRALGIIYLLESLTRTDVHSTRLLEYNNYQLEHLMPKKWKQHWALNPNFTVPEREARILTLGNLAMITSGLNKSIRNYDWKTKKEGKNNRPGLNTFANGINTIHPYLSLNNWDEYSIEERANKLAELANQKWLIPDNNNVVLNFDN